MVETRATLIVLNHDIKFQIRAAAAALSDKGAARQNSREANVRNNNDNRVKGKRRKTDVRIVVCTRGLKGIAHRPITIIGPTGFRRLTFFAINRIDRFVVANVFTVTAYGFSPNRRPATHWLLRQTDKRRRANEITKEK